MNHRIAAVLLFLGYLVLGFVIVDDYGITFDEAIQRRHGLVTVEYVGEKLGLDLPPLTDGRHGFAPYGMVYQVTALGLEWLFNADETPFEYYRVRHVLAFLLFGLALAAFYKLLRLRWPHRPWIPLIGTTVLLVSPRIFANAFYNPKDHILLVFYVVSTYTLFRYLHRRSRGALVLHLLTTAVALNTRPAALIIPVGTVTVLLAEQLFTKPPDYRRLIHAAVYLPGTALLAVAFFPFLWERTGDRATGTVTEMAHYDWGGDVLFFGRLIPADALPWYYLPAWVGITTPLVYLVLIILGIGLVAWRTFPRLFTATLYRDLYREYDLIQWMLALAPVILVIAINSTLYHGWRHLYFIYPSLVYLLVVAYSELERRYPRVLRGALAFGIVLTAFTMVRMHPHQQVYFNQLIRGKYTLQRFDMDYYGSGFRDALVQLADEIPEGETRAVLCHIWPCIDNIAALPPDVKNKIRLETKWHLADYVATNYGYTGEREAIPYRGEYFQDPAVEIYPDGKLTIGIYRVNQ